MLNDKLKFKGELNVLLLDKDGKVKVDKTERNLVVDSGLEWIASRMLTTGIPNEMSHMAIGTSSTGELAANTALGAEAQRNALTDGAGNDTSKGTSTGSVVTYISEFGTETAGTVAVAEAGIFNAASAGTMLCRTTFGVVTKENTDTLKITWTITLAAA